MNKIIQMFIGKKIVAAEFGNNEVIKLLFDDGTGLEMWDSGQDCCESRYVSTDDDIKDLVGERLAAVDEKEAHDIDDVSGEYHECKFLEVVTDRGSRVNFAFHNEHNGYYGGFSLEAKIIVEG